MMQTAFFMPSNFNFDRITVTKVADGTVMAIDGDSGLTLIADECAKEIAEILEEHGVTLTPVCQFVCSKATAYRYKREEE